MTAPTTRKAATGQSRPVYEAILSALDELAKADDLLAGHPATEQIDAAAWALILALPDEVLDRLDGRWFC